MRFKTIILGLFFGFIIWIGLPYLFISLNNYFNLPVIDYLPFKILGVVLIIAGLSVILHSVWFFKHIGKGTPVPAEPTRRLMISGLYKRTRNPMYLTHTAILSGEYLFFGHTLLTIYLFLAVLGFHLLVVKWEENQLKQKYGQEYLDYMKEVPRWL